MRAFVGFVMIVAELLTLVLAGTVARAQQPTAGSQPAPLTLEQNAKLKQRDALIPDIDKAQAQNKLEDAVQLIQKMMALEKVIFGPVHEEVAGSLDQLGTIQELRQDFKASRQARQEALDMYTKLYGAKHWRSTDARLALEHLEKVSRLSAEERQRLADAGVLVGQIRTFNSAKDYKKALELGLKVYEIRRKILGERSSQTLATVDWLAGLYAAQKDDANAEQYRRRHLEGARTLLGDEHPGYAYSLEDMGHVFAARKKHVEAVASYRDAWKLFIKVFGVRDKDTERTGNELFAAMRTLVTQQTQQDDLPAARRTFEELLALQVQHLGKTNSLAEATRRALKEFDELAKVTPEQRRLLVEADEAYGQANQLRWHGSKRLAALEPALRALDLRRQALGEQHPKTGEARSTVEFLLGDLANDAAGLEKKGQFPEARTLRAEVLAGQGRVHGPKHWRTISARLALADLEVLAKLSAAQRGQLAEADRLSAAADYAARLPGFIRQRYLDALPGARTALEQRQRLLGEEHPAAAAAHLVVAALRQRLGQLDSARTHAETALAICEKTLGKDHPETVRARGALGAVAALALAASPHADLGPEKQKKLQERDRIQEEEYLEHRRNRERPRPIEAQNRILALEREVYGDFDAEVAASYAVLGELFEFEGKFGAALSCRQGEVAIKKHVYGEDHWQTTEARFYVKWLQELARMDGAQRRRLFDCLDQGGLAQGTEPADKARALLPKAEKASATVRELLGANHLYYANSLRGLAEIYSKGGAHDRAEQAYLRAAEVTRTNLGPTHPGYRSRLEDAMNELQLQARSCQEQEKWAEARALLEKSAALDARLFGESSWQAADARRPMALNDRLSQLTSAQRDSIWKALENARANRYQVEKQEVTPDLLEKARATAALCAELLGAGFDETAESLTTLGLAYKGLNNYAAAVAPLQQALALREKLLGTAHPAYAESLSALGVVYYKMGDYVRAEPIFQEAKRCLEKVDPKSPIYASTLNNLAILHAALRDYPQAEQLSKEALRICRTWATDPSVNPTTDRLDGRNYHALLGEFRRRSHRWGCSPPGWRSASRCDPCCFEGIVARTFKVALDGHAGDGAAGGYLVGGPEFNVGAGEVEHLADVGKGDRGELAEDLGGVRVR